MNNILPLLQKAIVEYKSNGDTPADYTLTIPEQIINRFAELIIQECVSLLVNRRYMILDPLRQYSAEERVRVLKEHDKHTVNMILKHFD